MKEFSLKRMFANGELANRGSRTHKSDKTKNHIPKPRALRAEALESRELLSATPEFALFDASTSEQIESQVWENPSITFELDPDLGDSLEAEQGATAYSIDDSLIDLNVDPNSLTEEFVFNLSSNPTSTYTIYLDFDGHVTTGTYWNKDRGDVVTPAYDTDGDVSTFSRSELHDIYEIWLRVSEDYAPFDVNVTTVEPTLDQLIRTDGSDDEYGIRCCIGGSYNDWLGEACGGIAYVGSFTWDTDTPCFAFSGEGCGPRKGAAEAAAHEIGHTLGLGHDGIYNADGSKTEYYGGANDWAPIMGSGYSASLTQWSKGEYVGATNSQDDLAVIASNGFSYKTDDHRDLRVQATSFDLTSSGTVASGVIETNDDIDFFSFVNTGVADYLYVGGVQGVTNLDAVVSLYDSDGRLVKTYDPSNSYCVFVDLEELELDSLYYLSVSGTGLTVGGTLYYTDYASLGNYLIVAKQDDEQLDEYEPNNSFTQAYNLGFVNSEVVYDSMVVGSSQDSIDWYKFEIGATGASGNFIRTEYDKASDANRTMYLGLYDSNQNCIKYCFFSNTNYQKVDLNGIEAGTYYLRIYNYTTLSKPYEYTLTINAPNAEAPTYDLTSVRIVNEPKVGSTLLAVLEYQDATANYQWYYADSADSTSWTPIQGANDASFAPSLWYVGKYLKVVAEGTGAYEGTVEAITESPVIKSKNVDLVELTSISMVGTLSVGQDVATVLVPSGATANYQWYRATSETSKSWTLIEGANESSYSPTNADVGFYLKVVATGTGDYTGEISAVSSGRVLQSSMSLKSVELSGVFKMGETISTTLQPENATASYQWYRATSDTATEWILIKDAISASYVPNGADVGCYLKVVAKGVGYCSGEVSAVSNAKVAANYVALSSISISGVCKVDETLSTTLLPGGATANYQWYRATSSSASEWTPIDGANASTYKLADSDFGCYVKVVATGTGNYSGEVSKVSAKKIETNLVKLSSISISGVCKVGETLTTTLKPTGATANYQWYRADSSSASEWTAISGANASTYVLTSSDLGRYVKVVATGTGKYAGEVAKVSTNKVETNLTSLSSIVLSGDFVVGRTLTTTLRPSGATATYQWYRASSSSASEWTAISGANGSSYTLDEADLGNYIKVVAIGTGNYAGEVSKFGSSKVVMNLSSISMSGSFKVGQTIATTLKPANATVSYQWYRANSSSASEWTAISGANASTYQLAESDIGYYVKVVATGLDDYSGEVAAVSTSAVAQNYIKLSSISISGSFVVGETLKTSLRPTDADADYQWYRSISNDDSEWIAISGANESTYKIADSDVGYYLKVVATGTGKYEGVVSKTVSKRVDGLTAPTDLTVSEYDVASRTVALTWTDNSSLAKKFRIETSTDNGKTWKLLSTTDADATSKTVSVPLKDKTYMFRVAEYQGSKTSAWSNATEVQTVPYAPNNVKFAFNAGSSDSGVLTWKDASNSETRFVVERSLNGGEWEAIGTADANATKFEIENLQAEAKYLFRVVATNNFASATSKETSVTTTPKAPSNLVVTQGTSKSSFVLNWTDNSSVEKGFKIEYSADGGKTWKSKTTAKADETSKTVGLTAKNSGYLFRVAAYNNAGNSEWTTGSLNQDSKSASQKAQNEVLPELLQMDEEDLFWHELQNAQKN